MFLPATDSPIKSNEKKILSAGFIIEGNISYKLQNSLD